MNKNRFMAQELYYQESPEVHALMIPYETGFNDRWSDKGWFLCDIYDFITANRV